MPNPAGGGRLSRDAIAAIRSEYPIAGVLAQLGIAPPAGWDGVRDYWVSCPTPQHPDSTPSCVIHPSAGYFHCFGCGAGGDVFELVARAAGISSLAAIADVIRGGAPLTPTAGPETAIGKDRAGRAPMAEQPDLTRTPAARVLAANAAAWAYWTSDYATGGNQSLAGRARRYLGGRGIDVSALEAETGTPLAGHTPHKATGLVDHLRRRGFTDDELVDAFLAVRRGGGADEIDGTVSDKFRSRCMLPVRDHTSQQIIGFYGRATGTAPGHTKYLNTGHTVVFTKGEALYRPTVAPLDPHATVVLCEGSLDALAIAARAATASTSAHFAPVSPSGTALTASQAQLALAISPLPPVLCADGDDAGRAAGAAWVRTCMVQQREVLVTVLPGGHDPDSWLRSEGGAGLCAFTRRGCLDRPAVDAKPGPAGALIAEASIRAALTKAGGDVFAALAPVNADLARLACGLGDAAAQRFAASAAAAFADWGVGTEAALAAKLIAATRSARGAAGGAGAADLTSAGRPLL
jgi:DNA primase